jgi:heterodisulfide reductase subunit A-like polyferredoxin
MSPAAFICTTPTEREMDLNDLGHCLTDMGYDVSMGPKLCSPSGQAFIKKKAEEYYHIVLICSRGMGRDVFDGSVPRESLFFSYPLHGLPKELATLIHEEVTLMPSEKVLPAMPLQEVMIIGGGVAGIYAAVDLGEQGYKVYLVEKDPSIGGIMAALDKTFPTMDCSI